MSQLCGGRELTPGESRGSALRSHTDVSVLPAGGGGVGVGEGVGGGGVGSPLLVINPSPPPPSPYLTLWSAAISLPSSPHSGGSV